jgi:hypothetical protein
LLLTSVLLASLLLTSFSPNLTLVSKFLYSFLF